MKKFKRVYLEITNICNLNCPFCAKTKRMHKSMNVQEFTAIVEKIKDKTQQVYFHLMGEPFINPNLSEFLDICEKNGLPVNLNTNGSLLAANIDKLLNKPALRKLIISLHSYSANGGTNMDNFLDSIHDCVHKLEPGVIVEFRMWNLIKGETANSEEQQAVKKLCQHYHYDDEIDTKKNLKYKLSNNVFLNYGNMFVWPCNSKENYDEGFCYALRTQIGVLCDGSVVPCCLDNDGNMILGNLLTDNLDDILASPRAKAIYDGFTAHKKTESYCKQCNYLINKNS